MPEILESVLNLVFPKDQRVRELEVFTAEDLRAHLPKAAQYKENHISIFNYQNADVRQLIWQIKYKKNKRLAFMCAELLAEELLDLVYDKKSFYPNATFLLLPVPTSDKRKRQRGYTQTELVAGHIKKMLPPLQYCTETLRRVRHAPSQTKMSRVDRQKNIRGCFSVFNPDQIRDKIVILFDDVTTTGATLDEISKEITKHRPKEIVYLTIAH